MPYILLVEDNKSHALLLGRCLRQIQNAPLMHHVCDADTALEFLQAKFLSQDLPSLVLLDLRLPRLGGLELLRQLKDSPQYKSIPMIILSTSDRDSDIQMSQKYGASDFWSKPVSVDTLRQCLEGLSLFED